MRSDGGIRLTGDHLSGGGQSISLALFPADNKKNMKNIRGWK